MGLTDQEGARCPFPGVADDSGRPQPADQCPVPHDLASAGWDMEAHIEAMRRAKEGAQRSHLAP